MKQLNIVASELDFFVARLKEGTYSKVDRDLILSRIKGAIHVEDGIPESDVQRRLESDVPPGDEVVP